MNMNKIIASFIVKIASHRYLKNETSENKYLTIVSNKRCNIKKGRPTDLLLKYKELVVQSFNISNDFHNTYVCMNILF